MNRAGKKSFQRNFCASCRKKRSKSFPAGTLNPTFSFFFSSLGPCPSLGATANHLPPSKPLNILQASCQPLPTSSGHVQTFSVWPPLALGLLKHAPSDGRSDGLVSLILSIHGALPPALPHLSEPVTAAALATVCALSRHTDNIKYLDHVLLTFAEDRIVKTMTLHL